MKKKNVFFHHNQKFHIPFFFFSWTILMNSIRGILTWEKFSNFIISSCVHRDVCKCCLNILDALVFSHFSVLFRKNVA